MNTGTRKNNDKRDKGGRQRLIDAALKLFGEKGFDAVRARDVAAEAGVSHGLIRHHFSSMDGLRKAVDQSIGARFQHLLDQVPMGNPDELLGELMAAAEATYMDPVAAEQWWTYLRRSFLENSDASQELFDALADYYDEAMVRWGASDRIRDDMDPTWQALFHLFLDMGTMTIAPFVKRRYGLRLSDRGTMEQRNRYIKDIVENGLLKR